MADRRHRQWLRERATAMRARPGQAAHQRGGLAGRIRAEDVDEQSGPRDRKSRARHGVPRSQAGWTTSTGGLSSTDMRIMFRAS